MINTIKKKIIRGVVQDIIPNKSRSIKRIPIDYEIETPLVKNLQRKVTSKLVEDYDVDTVEPIFPKKTIKKEKINYLKYIISFIIILISFIIIGMALSLSYSKALITITPKVAYFNIDGIFTAKKNSPELLNDDLKYESITISDQIVETLPAVKGDLIKTKSKGIVNIYNIGTTSQILIAGTRLFSSNKLIYRTVTTVVVPSKKGINPGTISVGIIADQDGENYNINVSNLKGDFKLLGYKDTPKYNLFYARLKNNLVGGLSSNKITIDAVAKKDKIDLMKNILKDRLIKKIKEIVPSDHILYDSSYNIEYEIPEPIMKDAMNAEITIRGTIYAAIFNTDSLVKYIAGKEIKKFPSDTFIIDGDKKLTFKISNIKDFSIKKSTPLVFTLKGPISITGTFSGIKLKEELRGNKARLGNTIFAKYPAISNASAQITPFWMNSFPDDIKKITIEYKNSSK